MKDLTKEVNSRLYERVTSPLYSTFILSWIVTNWKFFYVTIFLNKEDVGMSKLTFIQNVLYPNWCIGPLMLFLIPAISTFCFIWVIPYVVNLAFEKTEQFKIKRRVKRLELLGKSVIDGEKYLELRESYTKRTNELLNVFKEKKKIDSEINEQKLKLTELQHILTGKEQQLQTYRADIDKANNQVRSLENELGNINHNISDFFQGEWINQYIQPDGTTGSEIFTITEGYKYIVQGHERFYIDRVSFNRRGGELRFRKVVPGIQRNGIENNLRKVNNDWYEGSESTGTKIAYKRAKIS